jgi:hypothetical protein
MRAMSFMLRKQTRLWWTRVKTDRKEANKGHVEKCLSSKNCFYNILLRDHIQSMRTRSKDFIKGA